MHDRLHPNDISFFRGQEDRLRIITGLTDLNQIRGWNILDLGCGSSSSDWSNRTRQYEAWFPRVCASHGATVIGIDIAAQDPNDEGVYTHIAADLGQLLVGHNLVDLVNERKFNLIHASAILCDGGPGIRYEWYIENLLQQASALLVEGGMLVVNDEIFTWSGSKFNHVGIYDRK